MSVCLSLPLDFINSLKHWELVHLTISRLAYDLVLRKKKGKEGNREEIPKNYLIHTHTHTHTHHTYMHKYIFPSYNQNVKKLSKFLISLNYNVSNISLNDSAIWCFFKKYVKTEILLCYIYTLCEHISFIQHKIINHLLWGKLYVRSYACEDG